MVDGTCETEKLENGKGTLFSREPCATRAPPHASPVSRRPVPVLKPGHFLFSVINLALSIFLVHRSSASKIF
jgi:hypothetical protein